MDALLVHLALLAYTAAAAAFLGWLVHPDPRLPKAGRWLLIAGVAVHAGALAAFLGLPGRHDGQLFSLLAAAIVAGYLLVDRARPMPVAGAFVAPLAVAAMVPAHLVHAERAAAPALWNSAALYFHIGSATLGTASLTLAFGLAALYLASERQAKTRHPGRLLARVASLESIERSGYQLAVWGFIFLSLAIGTGSLASQESSGSPLPFAPKQAFALLAWAFLATLIQARLVAGWRGRRAALLVVVGFAMLVGVYAGLYASGPAQGTAIALGELP